MTKFLDAIKIYLDPNRHIKPVMPEVLLSSINIEQDYCSIQHLDRFLLKLEWETSIWLHPPVSDSVLEEARNETISNFKGLIYGDIYNVLVEIRGLIKYYRHDEALEQIQKLIAYIMQ